MSYPSLLRMGWCETAKLQCLPSVCGPFYSVLFLKRENALINQPQIIVCARASGWQRQCRRKEVNWLGVHKQYPNSYRPGISACFAYVPSPALQLCPAHRGGSVNIRCTKWKNDLLTLFFKRRGDLWSRLSTRGPRGEVSSRTSPFLLARIGVLSGDERNSLSPRGPQSGIRRGSRERGKALDWASPLSSSNSAGVSRSTDVAQTGVCLGCSAPAALSQPLLFSLLLVSSPGTTPPRSRTLPFSFRAQSLVPPARSRPYRFSLSTSPPRGRFCWHPHPPSCSVSRPGRRTPGLCLRPFSPQAWPPLTWQRLHQPYWLGTVLLRGRRRGGTGLERTATAASARQKGLIFARPSRVSKRDTVVRTDFRAVFFPASPGAVGAQR